MREVKLNQVLYYDGEKLVNTKNSSNFETGLDVLNSITAINIYLANVIARGYEDRKLADSLLMEAKNYINDIYDSVKNNPDIEPDYEDRV